MKNMKMTDMSAGQRRIAEKAMPHITAMNQSSAPPMPAASNPTATMKMPKPAVGTQTGSRVAFKNGGAVGKMGATSRGAGGAKPAGTSVSAFSGGKQSAGNGASGPSVKSDRGAKDAGGNKYAKGGAVKCATGGKVAKADRKITTTQDRKDAEAGLQPMKKKMAAGGAVGFRRGNNKGAPRSGKNYPNSH